MKSYIEEKAIDVLVNADNGEALKINEFKIAFKAVIETLIQTWSEFDNSEYAYITSEDAYSLYKSRISPVYTDAVFKNTFNHESKL